MPIITASKMSMILSLFRSAHEFQSGCPGSVPKAAEKTMASYMSVFPLKFRSPNGVGTMSQYPFCVLCGIASAYKEIEDKGKVAFAVTMGILGIGLLVALTKD